MEATGPAATGGGPAARRVFLLGGTGTIGRATAGALVEAGHIVTAFIRERGGRNPPATNGQPPLPPEAVIRFGEVTDPLSLERDGFRGEPFDVLVSCLASRTGAPRDAWAVDYEAHRNALREASKAGVRHVVLLSAICVQKPKLAFQRAKLAFERELMASGLTYSIVRPTAYFKSLSGQIDRIRRGRSYLLFGDGTQTACKPISDRDLGLFLAGCIADETRHDKILPIGGPGPALTPREQGEELFRLLDLPPKFSSIDPRLFGAAGSALAFLGRLVPYLAEKGELARIAHHYATHSMLVWDDARGRYDAELTPSFGSETLFEHYRRVVAGESEAGPLGEHELFG